MQEAARATPPQSDDEATARLSEQAAAAAEAETGRVRILADNGWSTVIHEGRELGRTPLTIDLPVGRQTLTVLPFGQSPGDTRTVTVYAASTVTLRVTIQGRQE
jgi:hypothetical protein